MSETLKWLATRNSLLHGLRFGRLEYVHDARSEAEKVEAGLTSGGSLEVYFAPERTNAITIFYQSGSNNTSSTAEWSPTYRHIVRWTPTGNLIPA